MELGKNIAALRALTGLKSKELAEIAGIKQSYISSIEKGRKIPTIQVLLNIAQALGVTVSELLGESRQQLSPCQRKLIMAARNLSDAQLGAVINLLNELNRCSVTKREPTGFLVAEDNENE